MTREEKAISVLYGIRADNLNLDDAYTKDKYDALTLAIKALEQESILNKIRAEIDTARFIDKDTKLCKNANASGLEVAMQIIDKYKAESEDVDRSIEDENIRTM